MEVKVEIKYHDCPVKVVFGMIWILFIKRISARDKFGLNTIAHSFTGLQGQGISCPYRIVY